MPRLIGGVEFWPHKGKVVESESGDNLAGVDVVYTAIDTGEVLEVRDPVTEDVLSVSADFRGQTPEVILLPAIQAFVAVEGGRTYQSDTSEFLTMKAQVDTAVAAAADLAVVADGLVDEARGAVEEHVFESNPHAGYALARGSSQVALAEGSALPSAAAFAGTFFLLRTS